MDQTFLTNITSSEGILARFSDICRKLDYGNYTKSQLHRIIQDSFNLSNEKVRERHLHIMVKLHLLAHVKIDNKSYYHLDLNGKIINSLDLKKRTNVRHLFQKEKIIYLNELFNSLKIQLGLMIKTISKYNGYNRDFIISKYFESALEYDIWNKAIITKGINSYYNNNKHIRSFENRFRCMEKWLEDLELILKKEDNNLRLTRKGSQLNYYGEINIVNALKIYGYTNINLIKIDEDFNIIKKLFIHYYNKLKEPTNIADITALYNLLTLELCIKYNKQLLLNHKDLLLNKLWKENMIASISNDVTGQLRYIILNT